MAKNALRANARIIVLSGAALLLGSWNLLTVDPEPSSTPAPDPFATGPVPGPELVAVGVQPVARGTPHEIQASQGAVQAVGQSWTSVDATIPQEAGPAAPEGSYGQTLDSVFAPERLVGDSLAGRASGIGSQDPDAAQVAVAGAGWGMGSTQPQAEAAPAVESTVARKHPGTEKAYYEEFIALAKEDAHELERQAAAVLREAGGTNKKVAVLCALYSTDRTQALDYFVSAITTLPDVSTPQGVSVPVFAAGFLGNQANDPAAQALAERIAWAGYLDVSADLRRVAAKALLANASDADLRRYAASGYQIQDVAAVAGDRTP